ncbi:MAG TPA: hypothetical protein VNW46_14535 [Gemmatimonadaceae bacterium]|nr:hypothetical protein [Gemmatimonadaceae bacterium]
MPRTARHIRYHLSPTEWDASGAYAWAGEVDGALTGHATLEVQFPTGQDSEPGVGLVQAHWVLHATPTANSFESSLSGTTDPTSGTTHLIGAIIKGAGRGQMIEIDTPLHHEPNGTLSDCDGVITIWTPG